MRDAFRHSCFLIALCILPHVFPPLLAQPLTRETTRPEPSLGERLDNLGLLYKGEDSEIVQELWLLGRFHGQYYWAEGNNDASNNYETRRFRFGGQAKLFRRLTLHAQAISGSNFDPVYNGFTELWAQWAFSRAFAVTIGQQKHRFTHDRNVSSRYLTTLERALLTNMFAADYTPAVTLQGTIDKTSYYVGLFSNAAGTDMGKSFTELNSGHSFLAAAYHDVHDFIGTDSAFFHATYLHSEANARSTNLNRFNNGLSSALILTEGPSSLEVELTSGMGSSSGNAFGVNVQPGYYITNKWQVAGRYQFATSTQSEGLIPQRRYEREANIPAGDRYQAAYLGLNHYIAKHRIKVMAGAEYSTMNGEHVWTFSTAFRFFFGPHSGGAYPMNQMLPGSFFDFD